MNGSSLFSVAVKKDIFKIIRKVLKICKNYEI